MSKRNNFTRSTKLTLGKRAQFTCAFPRCGVFTTGPGPDSASSATIGVAAHIHAAAPGGKRYLPKMTAKQCIHADNGIWLCQTHATLIDQDELLYPAEKLRRWKTEHERKAAKRLHAGVKSGLLYETVDISSQIYTKEPWDLALPGRLPVPPRPLPQRFDAYKWLMRKGAGQYLETQINVYITNKAELPLIITDIKVQSEVLPAYAGSLVHSDTAGSREREIFVFDLDGPDPRPMRAFFDNGIIEVSEPKDFFRSEFLCIPPGDVQGLLIVGRAKARMVKWHLNIVTLCDSREEVKIVDYQGTPFITTGAPEKGFSQYYEWEWYRAEGRRFKEVKQN